MSKPRILCYIPLSPGDPMGMNRSKPRIYARTLQSVMRVIWDAPMDYVMGRDDKPEEPPYDNLCRKHNQARQMALEGGYDALWMVESDMIVPPIALERLTRVEADIAYALYCSRHGNNRWLSFLHIGEKIGVSVSDDVGNARAAWGNVIETQGVGMGCTLIWRHVLEEIEFRHPGAEVADDWFYALDAKAKGFAQKHDLGVVCGHIIGAPSPKILWPDLEHPRLCGVEFFDEAPPERIQPGEMVEVVVSKLETKGVYAEAA